MRGLRQTAAVYGVIVLGGHITGRVRGVTLLRER
jgi:hypothetical protein